ncbi:MAG: hypothetical protein IPL96_01305 [Holophagaceae bacterium]|nr:hypothetical protein [Holophagaceae bacterium]
MKFRPATLAFVFACLPALAQATTISLPPEAVLIKINRGRETFRLKEVAKAQGPAQYGLTKLERQAKTIALTLQDRPLEVAQQQLRDNGVILLRYLIPMKDLGTYFEFDEKKIWHVAPQMRADFFVEVNAGGARGGDQLNAEGTPVGYFWAYQHSRTLRGVKSGLGDFLKKLSNEPAFTPLDYEFEMRKYWTYGDPEELVVVDVLLTLLPMGATTMVESVQAGVVGLVDESFLPYTKAAKFVLPTNLGTIVSDPRANLADIGQVLALKSKEFSSKKLLEKQIQASLKEVFGSFIK